jgi:hypothetical protein
MNNSKAIININTNSLINQRQIYMRRKIKIQEHPTKKIPMEWSTIMLIKMSVKSKVYKIVKKSFHSTIVETLNKCRPLVRQVSTN